ncbi:MAG: transcription elongation factor GreA [Acidobacteriota bacterium]
MKEAKKKLENEIRKLDRELRGEIPKALRKALELGDLRENAEYQTAKERQSYLQAQLAQLRQRLAQLSMINLNKIPTDKVSYGSTVVLLDLNTGKEVTYRLVSSEESDVGKGLISTSSPIGKSLIGHDEGDEVHIQTPRGVKNYEIVKLTTIHETTDS